MEETYHKHISSKHKLFDLKLGEVWRYRGLAWLFTKRTFKVGYKQTILGPLWFFITPVISAFMNMIVFNNIAKLSTDGLPQIAFHLVGSAIWAYFSGLVNSAAYTFTGNASLFGKVYFPRLISPLSDIMSHGIKFGIQLLLVLGLLCYYVPNGMVSPNWLSWLLIPVILVWLGLLGVGVGIIISSFTTKYRDLSIVIGFGLQFWMYGSPVVYPLNQLGGILRTLCIINPATAPIELLRYAILGQGTIEPASLISSIIFTVVLAFCGIVLFNRVERTFIDTI